MAISTPKLDIFFPDTHNILTLAVADISFYPRNYNITNPTIEVTPPSFPTVTLPFSANTINILNSNILGITCSDESQFTELPDGYWTFKYSIAPPQTYNVTKSFFRSAQIERRFSQAFMTLNLTQCDETVKEQEMKKLDQINYWIQTAIAAGNDCNPVLALQNYRIADRLLCEFINNKCYGNVQKMWC